MFGNQFFDFGNSREIKIQRFGDIRKRLARTNIQHQTIFARRHVFELTNVFSEEYKIVSDYDWTIKAFLVNRCKYHYLDRAISVMATQGISWTRDFDPERRKVMKKYFKHI